MGSNEVGPISDPEPESDAKPKRRIRATPPEPTARVEILSETAHVEYRGGRGIEVPGVGVFRAGVRKWVSRKVAERLVGPGSGFVLVGDPKP
jgi:hypothetical protein